MKRFLGKSFRVDLVAWVLAILGLIILVDQTLLEHTLDQTKVGVAFICLGIGGGSLYDVITQAAERKQNKEE